MSRNKSPFEIFALIGLGAAAVAGGIAAYQYRKEIREKANEWATITISRIKRTEEPEFYPVDENEDGIIDTVLADIDGDGIIDTAVIDTDGDDEAEVILIDTDGDGKVDAVLDPDDLAEAVEDAVEDVIEDAVED